MSSMKLLFILWQTHMSPTFPCVFCEYFVKLEAYPLSDPAQIDIFLQGLSDSLLATCW